MVPVTSRVLKKHAPVRQPFPSALGSRSGPALPFRSPPQKYPPPPGAHRAERSSSQGTNGPSRRDTTSRRAAAADGRVAARDPPETPKRTPTPRGRALSRDDGRHPPARAAADAGRSRSADGRCPRRRPPRPAPHTASAPGRTRTHGDPSLTKVPADVAPPARERVGASWPYPPSVPMAGSEGHGVDANAAIARENGRLGHSRHGVAPEHAACGRAPGPNTVRRRFPPRAGR